MVMPMESETIVTSKPPKKTVLVLLSLLLVISLGVLAAKKYKSLFVVGKVNGQFITRLELEKSMNDRYAKATFDDLASTNLLYQLASQNGVTVSDEELNKEIADTETRLGGKEALTSTLDRMGYTQDRFTKEMNMLVLEKKLAAKLFKAEVSDEEVAKFYTDNKTLFPDKKLDEVKADISNNLVSQELQQQFTTWFQEQKDKAVIKSYL
jgi:foldase protein PrsA